MNNEINLLYSKKQLQRSQLATRVKILRYIALGVLFASCAVSMVLFILVLASPIPELRKQEDQLTQTLSASHEKILRQTLLSMRLTDINSLMNKRSNYGEVIATLRKELPSNSEIMSFSIEKDEISLTIVSDDLTKLQLYFDTLKKYVKEKKMFSAAYLDILEAVRGEDDRISLFQAKMTITLL